MSGEDWPIVLPDRVSIQGTSALDCVFHGFRWRGDVEVSAVFEVAGAHEHSFIDSVTIRSARAHLDGSGTARGGAGIYIGGTVSCGLTVSNCFLFGNDVGIAVDSNVVGGQRVVHRPRIVNNTIAWNRCGLWNGDLSTAPTPTVGFNEPILLNNVFDSSPPPGWIIAGTSGFEGVSHLDLCTTSVQGLRDHNAWEVGRINLGGAIPGCYYQATAPRAAWAHPGNQVDLAPITVTGGRGVLYLNDVLRSTVGNLSPHDFRLSPWVSTVPAQPPSQPSPLVNAGRTTSVGAIAMANGQTMTAPPGLPASAEDEPATLHSWDWDADGYGNERVRPRAGFASQPWGDINIGADEVDALTVTGFIESTRIFSRNVPFTSGIADHTRIYFVDLPSATYLRPLCNAFRGRPSGGGRTRSRCRIRRSTWCRRATTTRSGRREGWG